MASLQRVKLGRWRNAEGPFKTREIWKFSAGIAGGHLQRPSSVSPALDHIKDLQSSGTNNYRYALGFMVQKSIPWVIRAFIFSLHQSNGVCDTDRKDLYCFYLEMRNVSHVNWQFFAAAKDVWFGESISFFECYLSVRQTHQIITRSGRMKNRRKSR